MPQTIALTEFQREEVQGLLDVIADDIANGDERIVWGLVESGALIVLDPAEAAEELRYRADAIEDQGHVVDRARGGAAAARSLRSLVARIAVPR